MRHVLYLSAAALAVLLLSAPAALADERPSAEERTRIEAALRDRGFQN